MLPNRLASVDRHIGARQVRRIGCGLLDCFVGCFEKLFLDAFQRARQVVKAKATAGLKLKQGSIPFARTSADTGQSVVMVWSKTGLGLGSVLKNKPRARGDGLGTRRLKV